MKRENVRLLILVLVVFGCVFAGGAFVLLFAAFGEYTRASKLPSAAISIHIKYFVLPLVWPGLCMILASVVSFRLALRLRTFLAPIASQPEKRAEPGQWPPAPIEQSDGNSRVD